jgi:hypothetical protein
MLIYSLKLLQLSDDAEDGANSLSLKEQELSNTGLTVAERATLTAEYNALKEKQDSLYGDRIYGTEFLLMESLLYIPYFLKTLLQILFAKLRNKSPITVRHELLINSISMFCLFLGIIKYYCFFKPGGKTDEEISKEIDSDHYLGLLPLFAILIAVQ